MLLRCTFVLPDDIDVGGHTAHLQVEDTTLADAPARIVTRTQARAADLDRAGLRLGPIDLDVEQAPRGRRYNLRGLLTQGGQLHPGDLLSTVAIPITGITDVDIPLTTVR